MYDILSIDEKLCQITENLSKGDSIESYDKDVRLISSVADDLILIVKERKEAWSLLLHAKLICVKSLMSLIDDLMRIVTSTDLEKVIIKIEGIHNGLNYFQGKKSPFYTHRDEVGLDVAKSLTIFTNDVLSLLKNRKVIDTETRMSEINNFLREKRGVMGDLAKVVDGILTERSIASKAGEEKPYYRLK